MTAWLSAFLFTQAVEVPIYLWPTKRRWLVAFGASAITHPFVWFAFPLLPLPYWWMVACAEAFAVVVEAVWLRAFGVSNAFAWSLLANASSVAIGLSLRAAFGWP